MDVFERDEQSLKGLKESGGNDASVATRTLDIAVGGKCRAVV